MNLISLEEDFIAMFEIRSYSEEIRPNASESEENSENKNDEFFSAIFSDHPRKRRSQRAPFEFNNPGMDQEFFISMGIDAGYSEEEEEINLSKRQLRMKEAGPSEGTWRKAVRPDEVEENRRKLLEALESILAKEKEKEQLELKERSPVHCKPPF